MRSACTLKRAYIRHRFTDYEADLDALWDTAMGPDDDSYHGVKGDAHRAVNEFLERHRR